MRQKSWTVAALTTLFALVFTVFFLLIPSFATIAQVDETIEDLVEEQQAKEEAAAAARASRLGPSCKALEVIVDEIRNAQTRLEPSIPGDFGPIEADLNSLTIPDAGLAQAVSKLAARFNPKFVQSKYSATVSLKDLILDSEVEQRIEKVQEICSR